MERLERQFMSINGRVRNAWLARVSKSFAHCPFAATRHVGAEQNTLAAASCAHMYETVRAMPL